MTQQFFLFVIFLWFQQQLLFFQKHFCRCNRSEPVVYGQVSICSLKGTGKFIAKILSDRISAGVEPFPT